MSNKINIRNQKTKVPTNRNTPITIVDSIQIGVFFDGTGNNKNSNKPKTNIAELWDLYDDSKSNIEKIYVRGVGTKIYTKEDAELKDGEKTALPGLITGAYWKERVELALEKILAFREDYKNKTKKYPSKIILDIFGFSRGAAIARHFVNVIYKGLFENAQAIKNETEIKVRFLGVFDTVGSFGKGGDNIDKGLNFHIDNNKAQYVYHITSEDELRWAFDSQSLKSNKNEVLNKENKDNCFIEETYVGVHADIGGGYGPKEEYQIEYGKGIREIKNNLCQVYCEKMYQKAKSYNVPFKGHLKWKINDEVRTWIKTIDDVYKENPKVRELNAALQRHERWKEIQLRKIYDIKNQGTFDRFGTGDVMADMIETKIGECEKQFINPLKELIEKEIKDKVKINNYIEAINCLHNEYVNISHDPFNYIVRDIYTVEKVDINTSDYPYNLLTLSKLDKFHLDKICKRDVFYLKDKEVKEVIAISYLKCYLKIVTRNKSTGKTTSLSTGYRVEVYDLPKQKNTNNIYFIFDDLIGTNNTNNAEGTLTIFCPIPNIRSSNKLNLAFSIHKLSGSGRKIGKWWYANFPSDGANEKRYTIKTKKLPINRLGTSFRKIGYIPDFTGNIIGDENNPLVIEIND